MCFIELSNWNRYATKGVNVFENLKIETFCMVLVQRPLTGKKSIFLDWMEIA